MSIFSASGLLFGRLTGGLVRTISQGVVRPSGKSRPSTDTLIQWKKLPIPKAPPKDRWDAKRALFGENDYKDLLGEGVYDLKRNVKVGPAWMHGFRGNELQMLLRKKRVEGPDMGPTKHYAMLKRIKFLHSRLNRNRGKSFYKDNPPPNYRDRQ